MAAALFDGTGAGDAASTALIANQAYNGRMGNRPGTNDGWNYRGGAPAQRTGRDAYGISARR